MNADQWMKSKNIAAYGPHLEPIIRLAFEAGVEAALADPVCEICDEPKEAGHIDSDGVWLCEDCYREAIKESGQ